MQTWWAVDAEWVEGLYERKEAAGADAQLTFQYKVGQVHDLGDLAVAEQIAHHGRGSEQRMAIVDAKKTCVYIMNVESGERVATVGPGGEGTYQFEGPLLGMAFGDSGELYVSDYGSNRIFVFDREGQFVRAFGEGGQGEGQFFGPCGLCFTADGNLVVADCDNHRVQIVRGDGTFVRELGGYGRWEGCLCRPMEVDVGPDGSIAVLDHDNVRVQVFDGEGRFVRRIGSEGVGPGQFMCPKGVAVGPGGEIIVTDCGREDVQLATVQVFSGEGELLQIIGAKGDSDIHEEGYQDKKFFTAGVDDEGRVLIAVRTLVGDNFAPMMDIVLLS